MITSATTVHGLGFKRLTLTTPPLRLPACSHRLTRRASVAHPTTCAATPLPPSGSSSLASPNALAPRAADMSKAAKIRVVVLGSGWGAVSFLRHLDEKLFSKDGPYELVLISPRNYFLFTPLLPSAMAGTVEERSLATPIRTLVNGKGAYYEAACIDIDPEARVLTCKYMEQTESTGAEPSNADRIFSVPYDLLLFSVGSVNNTFGIQGVREHCWFMKTMDDAHKLRVHISKTIEQAGLPSTTPAQRSKMLNFVVVGGGPTGVEVAAELHDLVTEDVARLFPHIKDDVRITLVDAMDKVLSSFHVSVSNYAGKLLTHDGIELKLNRIVQSVGDDSVVLRTKEGVEEMLEFGTCVWATGVAAHPLAVLLKSKLPSERQGDMRGLLVDSHMRVRGSSGSIFALGDAAITNQVMVLRHAEGLFNKYDKDKDGRLSLKELGALLASAKREFPQLGALELQLDMGPLGLLAHALFPNGAAEKVYLKHKEQLSQGLSLEQFQQLLADCDVLARPLPPTAQVARQQGEYLASLFNQKLVQRDSAHQPLATAAQGQELPAVKLSGKPHPFTYVHLGSLAYLGMNRAVMQLPTALPVTSLKGWLAAHVWRALELYMQVSAQNQWMLSNDWLRTKFFGRNISDV